MPDHTSSSGRLLPTTAVASTPNPDGKRIAAGRCMATTAASFVVSPRTAAIDGRVAASGCQQSAARK